MSPQALSVSLLLALSLAACTRPEAATPVVTRSLSDVERPAVELAAARMRCAACHASDSERIAPESAPSLIAIGSRKTPQGLRRWLRDPHAAKPGTAMPDLLRTLPEREREGALDELVHYLAAQGGPLAQVEREVEIAELELGRRLYHEVGCVACHEPQEAAADLERSLWSFPAEERIAPQVAATLGATAFDTDVDALAAFLRDPLAARPSGRMPSLLLDERESHAIATYLLRHRFGPEGLQSKPGWRYSYFEGTFSSATPGFGGAKPVREGTLDTLDGLPEHRPDNFAFEFSGMFEVEVAGTYTFWTWSDDGSNLYVDGRHVVANDGDHAPTERSGEIHLEAGSHSMVVAMYEHSGGEELGVEWQPPGGEKQLLPGKFFSHGSGTMTAGDAGFELDSRKVARGRERFVELGCGACHVIEDRGIEAPRAVPLAQLSDKLGSGCLSERGDDGAPRYRVDADLLAGLRALVHDAAALAQPRTEAQQLEHALTRLDCRACHRRDGQGGPDLARAEYFNEAVEADLGNEGRLPPLLDRVGAKLHGDWLARVLVEGARVRPYIATRMPIYGAPNVGTLAALFGAVDAHDVKDADPEFDPVLVEAGRKLAGKSGLGCIQCHRFNGTESLGIPAVDLATVHERIRGAWFRQLLADPKSLGMNTRMPEMWQVIDTPSGKVQRSPISDVLDGDPARQVEALWQYLSLGPSMPLPDGLIVPEREFELVPADGPSICAVFLRGHTPRGLMVGLPEQVHYAWDFEHARAVWAWRGRFFNAGGTWNGRAGALERPPAENAYEFPAGGALVADAELVPEPRGWRLDAAQRPVFRYVIGGVEVEETFEPRLRKGGAILARKLVARAPAEGPAPVLRLRHSGEELQFDSRNQVREARAEWEVTP
jgi:mono/diheme cytochrome c family protein